MLARAPQLQTDMKARPTMPRPDLASDEHGVPHPAIWSISRPSHTTHITAERVISRIRLSLLLDLRNQSTSARIPVFGQVQRSTQLEKVSRHSLVTPMERMSILSMQDTAVVQDGRTIRHFGVSQSHCHVWSVSPCGDGIDSTKKRPPRRARSWRDGRKVMWRRRRGRAL